MIKKGKILKYLSVTFLLFYSIYLIGCKTSNFEETLPLIETENVSVKSSDEYFRIYDISKFNEEEYKNSSKTKFIFVRLYYPHYNNPLCIENILKLCIRVVDYSKDKPTHASIGFSLKDEFYGLTTAGKKDLKYESCLDTANNGYMKKCNVEKSIQATYAIRVSEEEYNRAKEIIEMYWENPLTKYGIGLNFALAGYGIKRVYFSPKDNRHLGKIKHKRPQDSFDLETTSFVCSSFVAHVLVNSVDSIKKFFIDNSLNTKYIYPSDIVEFPGMQKLFMSTWIDYNIAAETFTSIYPSFVPFLLSEFQNTMN